MNRFHSNNALGMFAGIGPISADEARKRAAWSTTAPLNALARIGHPADAALDELGNVICYSKHGDHQSPYGWDIDHRIPTALGGANAEHNLRAIHCGTNRAMGGVLGALLGRSRSGPYR